VRSRAATVRASKRTALATRAQPQRPEEVGVLINPRGVDAQHRRHLGDGQQARCVAGPGRGKKQVLQRVVQAVGIEAHGLTSQSPDSPNHPRPRCPAGVWPTSDAQTPSERRLPLL
jgi:hypothetical protein